MVEVAAEKNDKGRASDPVAAARRRAMTLKLRQARQTLTTNSIDFAGQYASLARLFANSVVGATPVMALVALAVGAIACSWVPPSKVVTWGVLLVASLAVRYGLAIAYLDLPEPEKLSPSWRRKFIAAETFAGAAWALLVVLLLQSPDPNARTFVLVVLLLISGMTAMVASAIPFAVAGGLLPMAVFLTQNAPGLRTSPVKRGYWVVRRVLGEFGLLRRNFNGWELTRDGEQLGGIQIDSDPIRLHFVSHGRIMISLAPIQADQSEQKSETHDSDQERDLGPL